MKCKNCGQEHDNQFCPNCGASANFAQSSTNTNEINANQDQKVKKPFYKRIWFWILVILVIAILSAMLSPNEDIPNNPTPGITTSNNATAPSNNQDNQTIPNDQTNNLETTPSAKDTFGKNETVTLKDLKITLEDVDDSNGAEYFEAPEGKEFVGFKVSIENISDKDQAISSLLLFDAYIDSVKADYSINAAMAFSEGTLDGNVSPGKKLIGWYAIETPKDWKEIELEIKSSWLSSSKAKFAVKND